MGSGKPSSLVTNSLNLTPCLKDVVGGGMRHLDHMRTQEHHSHHPRQHFHNQDQILGLNHHQMMHPN
jgi:hypothetical protein